VAYPSARPWLYGIASNLVARHRRAEVRRYRALSRTERSTVVRNATIDPLEAGNSTGEVRKGSTVVAERVATAIVDKPGQTR
jgi:DNA-directed RNA polymerase specialized sigma24 family protein